MKASYIILCALAIVATACTDNNILNLRDRDPYSEGLAWYIGSFSFPEQEREAMTLVIGTVDTSMRLLNPHRRKYLAINIKNYKELYRNYAAGKRAYTIAGDTGFVICEYKAVPKDTLQWFEERSYVRQPVSASIEVAKMVVMPKEYLTLKLDLEINDTVYQRTIRYKGERTFESPYNQYVPEQSKE